MTYQFSAVPIAAGVFWPLWKTTLPPWVAGLAMALSSLSVVGSSLLLNCYSPPAHLASSVDYREGEEGVSDDSEAESLVSLDSK